MQAISQEKTDQEKTNAALNAVASWYWQQGYFGRSYDIQDQVEEIQQKDSSDDDQIDKDLVINAVKRIYGEMDIPANPKIESNEEGFWVEARVFLYHFQVDNSYDPSEGVNYYGY